MSGIAAVETKAGGAAGGLPAGFLRPRLEVRIFGRVSLGWAGEEPWSPPRRDARRLLAHLALHFDRPQDRHGLAFRLWPDVPEEVALNRLRRMLNVLRSELKTRGQDGAITLQADHQMLGLRWSGTLWVDTVAFEHACEDLPLLADADAAVLLQFEDLLLPACRLLDGELCAEDPFLADQAMLLRERCRAALALLRDRLAARKELEAAARVAARLVDLDPLSESATGELMRLLWLMGCRGEAMRAFERCAAVILTEQGELPAPWLAELRAAIDRGATYREVDRLLPRARAPRLPGSQGLPRPISRFFGREDQLAWLAEALYAERMVSILGPGGIGKTRLAIEAGRANEEAYPDGIYFLPLDEITLDEGVPVFLVQALGYTDPLRQPATEQAIEMIGNRRLLLVLDNCEHVLAGATRLAADVLEGCMNAGILATSRRLLDLPERRDLRLGSLFYPPAEAELPVEELAEAASIALFVDRMNLIGLHQAKGAADLRTIARICRRLEGIPLALELAAARTSILTLPALEQSLSSRLFTVLGGPRTDAPERHHAMWATLSWSYGLLDERDRCRLRWLSVFPQDFGREGAGWLLAVMEGEEEAPAKDGEGDALTGAGELTGLLETSLLRATGPHGDGAAAQDDGQGGDAAEADLQAMMAALQEQAVALVRELFPPEEGETAGSGGVAMEGATTAEAMTMDDGGVALTATEPNPEGGAAAAGTESAEPRYRMYAIVREFGRQYLRDSGEYAQAREACIAYYAQLAQRAGEGYAGPDQAWWYELLQAEALNFAEVLRWLEADADWGRALPLALSLADYWYQTACYGAEMVWVATVLANEAPRPHERIRDYTRLRHRYAIMLYGAGKVRQAIELAESCLDEPSYVAEVDDWAKLVFNLAIMEQAVGDLGKAERLCREVLSQELTRVRRRQVLGYVAFLTHRMVSAGEAERKFRELLDEPQDPNVAPSEDLDLREGLGYALCALGRYGEAVSEFAAALRTASDVGVFHTVVSGVLGIAMCCDRTVQGSGDALAIRSYQIAKHASAKTLESVARGYVGEMLVDRRDLHRARLFLESGLRENQLLGDEQGALYALFPLIEALVEAGRHLDALALYHTMDTERTGHWNNVDLVARGERARIFYWLARSDKDKAFEAAREAHRVFLNQQNRYETQFLEGLLHRFGRNEPIAGLY